MVNLQGSTVPNFDAPDVVFSLALKIHQRRLYDFLIYSFAHQRILSSKVLIWQTVLAEKGTS